MKGKRSNITTLDQFKDKHYGKKGTKKRDKLGNGECGLHNFSFPDTAGIDVCEKNNE